MPSSPSNAKVPGHGHPQALSNTPLMVGDTDKACRIATAAFDSAVPELDTLSEETYKQSTLLLQVIRDCSSLWENGPSSPRSADKFGPRKGPGSGRMVMFE